MSLKEILSQFLTSKSSKALIESTVDITKEDSSTRQAGTGQTGQLINKKGSTAHIDNSTTNNYNFTFNITDKDIDEETKKILQESFHSGKIQFLYKNSEQEISGYNAFAQNSPIEELTSFFSRKISPEDILLLRTGLYVQHLNNIGDVDQAIRIRDHASKDRRSRNIINLASAGYFESYIKPIFENNEPEIATIEYNDIVRYMPETIFINNKMAPEDIALEVDDKIQEKEQYHIAVSKIMINGIGQQCIQSIEEAIIILNKKYPHFSISKEIKRTNDFIYIKVRISLD